MQPKLACIPEGDWYCMDCIVLVSVTWHSEACFVVILFTVTDRKHQTSKQSSERAGCDRKNMTVNDAITTGSSVAQCYFII